jgi:hypothetical protein
MSEDIRIEVDVDALNDMPIESLDLIDKAQTGKLKGSEMLDLLDGFVVGGVRGRGFKVRDLKRIAEAVSAAFRTMSEGEASASV